MISEEQEVSLATRKTKGAKGGGTIRQRPDGRWEARYTLGIDPGTGKQIQKSVYGKTQREVRQKLTAITAEIDSGVYQEPCKMTVNEWLDIWLKDYQIDVKDSTAYLYERQAKLYLRPALGNTPLETLKAHMVQRLYNSLSQEHDGQPALSAKTIKNTRSRRIVTNVVEKDGLLEGLVQHAVNVLDGFSTQRRLPIMFL